ncbi:CDK-activating kinase assembly factor MAT1 [Nematocida sp. AWRm80]|nr:CDK-activating kinase assembly factor MAT1 [Nematocida sp. AWRm80]
MKSTEVFCPQCKSNSYINPGIKIFVSPCYHSLCEMCVSRLFSNSSNKCPECDVILRRSNYTSQTFEDVWIERECRVRKTIHTYIGRTIDDYSDEEEYNEYLEKVEEIVDELMEMKGPREITARMQQIKEEYKQSPRTPAQGFAKKRKTEEPTKIFVRKAEYFYPPTAIDPETIPQEMFLNKTYTHKGYFKDLISVLIRKAAGSLVNNY